MSPRMYTVPRRFCGIIRSLDDESLGWFVPRTIHLILRVAVVVVMIHEWGPGSGHIGQGRIVQGIHRSGDASFKGYIVLGTHRSRDASSRDAWSQTVHTGTHCRGITFSRFKNDRTVSLKKRPMDSTLNTNSLKSHSSPVLKFRIDWIAGRGGGRVRMTPA